MEVGTIIYPLSHFASAYRALLSHAGVSIAGSAKANYVTYDTTMLNVKVTELDEIVPAITFEAPLNDQTYSNINVCLSTIVKEILKYIAG